MSIYKRKKQTTSSTMKKSQAKKLLKNPYGSSLFKIDKKKQYTIAVNTAAHST